MARTKQCTVRRVRPPSPPPSLFGVFWRFFQPSSSSVVVVTEEKTRGRPMLHRRRGNVTEGRRSGSPPPTKKEKISSRSPRPQRHKKASRSPPATRRSRSAIDRDVQWAYEQSLKNRDSRLLEIRRSTIKKREELEERKKQEESGVLQQLSDLKGDVEVAVDNELTCIVCLDNRLQVLLKPCNHLVFCLDCARDTAKKQGEEVFSCPKCRAVATGAERVYF